jgi:hypothetical protein
MTDHTEWLNNFSQFEALKQELTNLIGQNIHGISVDIESTANSFLEQLAHELEWINFSPKPDQELYHWTTGNDGEPNSSQHYFLCIGAMSEILEANMIGILIGKEDTQKLAAEQILVKLTQEYGLYPPKLFD